MEFKSYPKIEQVGKLNMHITQKIHGSNAQVFIKPSDFSPSYYNPPGPNVIEVDGKYFDLYIGSRNRWITPEDDNYGFATMVYANKEEFVRRLGVGQHFGEWAGPGINSGEGLTQKTFVLFDHWKFPAERVLPPNTVVVPVLYSGGADLGAIEKAMNELKQNGSKLVPGFTRPEGVVINLAGVRYKKVFTAEESSWQRSEGPKREKVEFTLGHLLQPIRLEKLLSRDERYVISFPDSLPLIAKDYVQDLIDEGQMVGSDDDIKAMKKQLGGHLYAFIKDTFNIILEQKLGVPG